MAESLTNPTYLKLRPGVARRKIKIYGEERREDISGGHWAIKYYLCTLCTVTGIWQKKASCSYTVCFTLLENICSNFLPVIKTEDILEHWYCCRSGPQSLIISFSENIRSRAGSPAEPCKLLMQRTCMTPPQSGGRSQNKRDNCECWW